MSMNYQQTIDYLYTRLPMFTRDGASAFKKNLDNTWALCEMLHQPQQKFKSIHIAGTNGKGSTSHILAAIFQAAGYQTGLYTSPHLLDFRERIRINGEMISQNEVVQWVQDYQSYIESIQPSFFELTVAMAFDHFARHEVDVAIIEVGLGGLLDSTNVIQPELSVITNISMDHTNLLGNTLPEIAAQKAGIIKSQTPVVIGEHQTETDVVFEQIAELQHAPICFAEDVVQLKNIHFTDDFLKADVYFEDQLWLPELLCDLNGTYQVQNITTVLCSVKQCIALGFQLEDAQIRTALKAVKKMNHLQGRWQTLQAEPRVVVDTGHNEAGVMQVIQNLKNVDFENLHLVIGMVSDKDVAKVLRLFPEDAQYYFCKANLPRAMHETELQSLAKQTGRVGEAFSTVEAAVQNALKYAKSNDLVFIGGSTFVVAEALPLFPIQNSEG